MLQHPATGINIDYFLEFVPTVQLIPYIYPAFVPFGRYFTKLFATSARV
jgi:hypothetical protein